MNPAAGRYPIAAAALAVLIAGTVIPTPMYELYRRVWGITPAQISLVFAIFAASLIPSLLFLGGISDTLGRRCTLLIALGLAIVAALSLAFAENIWWLAGGRILQGLAIGIGYGTATAAIREWMAERLRPRAGLVTNIAIAVGSAAGGLIGGIVGQYSALPLRLPYFVLIVLALVVSASIATVPSCAHLAPAMHTKLPMIPSSVRRPFAFASFEAATGWATFSLFNSLVPSFLAGALEVRNLMLGAVIVTGIQAGSVTGSFIGRPIGDRRSIVVGQLALVAGFVLVLVAVILRTLVPLGIGTAVIGIGTVVIGVGGGLANLAGLNIVNAIAPSDHRAEMLSAYLVCCYTGFSVPSLAIGILANAVGLYPAIIGGGLVLSIIALATIAATTERNLQVATA